MRAGKLEGMRDLPVEKRVGGKKVWTKGAEGYLQALAMGSGGMGSSGVLVRKQRG